MKGEKGKVKVEGSWRYGDGIKMLRRNLQLLSQIDSILMIKASPFLSTEITLSKH